MKRCPRIVILFLLLTAMTALSAIAVAQEGKAPTRDQVKDQDKWNLADFFPNDEAWEADFTALKARIPDASKFEGKLAESSTSLLSCLALNDTLGMRAHRLYVYAALNLDSDNRVSKYQEMRDKAYSIYSQIG